MPCSWRRAASGSPLISVASPPLYPHGALPTLAHPSCASARGEVALLEEARATRILQLTVDGAGAELHTSACSHCRRILLPLLQKPALECHRIPRAWVWASVAWDPSSEDYLKDNFSSQPNVSTVILYQYFVACDVCGFGGGWS